MTAATTAATPSNKLHLGLFLPIWEDKEGKATTWRQLRELAQIADEAGIDSLWVPDHFLIYPTWGYWEAWTMLSAIAEATTRATIGPLVTCTSFREPALLALMAHTLNEISEGRLVLGLGAGYPDRDLSWSAFGYATDHPAGRFEEAIEIIVRLLREGHLNFHGKYYNLEGCDLRLRSASIPPVWVGAIGPRMLRLTAQWADACNLRAFADEIDAMPATLAKVDQACRDVGRDPTTLARTAFTMLSFAEPGIDLTRYRSKPLLGSPEEQALKLHALHRMGLQHVACIIDPADKPGPLTQYPIYTPAALERFLLVHDELRKLEAAQPSQL